MDNLFGPELVNLPDTNPWGRLSENPHRVLRGIWCYRIVETDHRYQGGFWIAKRLRPMMRKKFPAIATHYNGAWWEAPYDYLAIISQFPEIVYADELFDLAFKAQKGEDFNLSSHPVKATEFAIIFDILTELGDNQ